MQIGNSRNQFPYFRNLPVNAFHLEITEIHRDRHQDDQQDQDQ